MGRDLMCPRESMILSHLVSGLAGIQERAHMLDGILIVNLSPEKAQPSV